jgi:hypothetical protein
LGDVCGVGGEKVREKFTLFKRVFMERRGVEGKTFDYIFFESVIKSESIWRYFKIHPMFFLNLI